MFKIIQGYGDMTLKETRGTQRMVAMVALATRGNNWRNLEKCHGWRAAVDMPRPSDVFIPQYFHCWEEGLVREVPKSSRRWVLTLNGFHQFIQVIQWCRLCRHWRHGAITGSILERAMVDMLQSRCHGLHAAAVRRLCTSVFSLLRGRPGDQLL